MMKKLFSMAFLLLSACAVEHAKLDANPAFSTHSYNNYDLVLLWKTEKSDNHVRIEGRFTNPRIDTPYYFFDLTAKLLDENGRTLAQGDSMIQSSFKEEPFSIDIPLAQSDQFKRIQFSYSYATPEDVYYLKKIKALP